MSDHILAIVLALLGSSGFFSMISLIINKRDGKADSLKRIETNLDSLKRDNLRTQLLMMMSDYPDQEQEIYRLAERYFVEMDGNWYMSSVFNRYLTERNLPKPDWYKH